MRKLRAFDSLTLDGYFSGPNGDFSWSAKNPNDAEWNAFVSNNAKNGGILVMGRKTYEIMKSYWPSPPARRDFPEVAEQMNSLPKVVFSRSLKSADWSNTKIVKDDPAAVISAMKKESGGDLTILGSGSIVSQLAQAGLIDEYEFVMTPVVLGEGRTLFEGMKGKHDLTLKQSRSFHNGNVVLWYEPAA
jgi:dihydrofolate reductase